MGLTGQDKDRFRVRQEHEYMYEVFPQETAQKAEEVPAPQTTEGALAPRDKTFGSPLPGTLHSGAQRNEPADGRHTPPHSVCTWVGRVFPPPLLLQIFGFHLLPDEVKCFLQNSIYLSLLRTHGKTPRGFVMDGA